VKKQSDSGHACPKRAWLICALLGLGIAPALAQDASGFRPEAWIRDKLTAPPQPVGNEPGRAFPWRNAVTPGQEAQVTKAQAAAWEQQLRAIADYLSAQPLMQSPRGFFPSMRGHVSVVAAGAFVDAPAKAPLAGGVEMGAWTPEAVSVGPDGTLKMKPHHLRSLRIELNYIYPPRGEQWMRDGQGEFGVFHVQGHHAGFPISDNMLLVTRDGRLPFKPVSQERALNAFIQYQTAQLKTLPLEPLRTALTAAESRLAAMTPTERARAAWIRPYADRAADRFGINLVDEGKGHALVAFDEAFFDARQPRHQLRIAMVRELQALADVAHGPEQGSGTVDERVALLLFQQVDWRDFAQRFLHAR
jgi:hypothetical protein